MDIQTGKAIEVEAGKTYILETDKNITYEQAMRVLKVFKDTTGSKAVLLSDGMRIAVDSEDDIRERIAEEIFNLKTDEGRKTPWNPLTPEAEIMAWKSGYAEARNQAGFIARGNNDD